jgi:hypothetical protein
MVVMAVTKQKLAHIMSINDTIILEFRRGGERPRVITAVPGFVEDRPVSMSCTQFKTSDITAKGSQ